jgi:DNA-binding NtrC family response regulator
MAALMLHRKILVLIDESPIRNLLNLVRALQSETADEECANAVTAISNRKGFDAVVLDLRCSKRPAGGEVRGIHRIHFSVLGRVLAVTAETNGPNTMDLIERYLVNGLPSTLLWLVSHRYKSA